jgi:putative Flp pilus-assembly TadE/G-like protein
MTTNGHPTASTLEVPMKPSVESRRHGDGRQRGQIIVIAVLSMVTMIGGVALVLEGGNAYAQQRGVQNGADAAANSGATVLAQRLGGAAKTDADVVAAVTSVSGSNAVSSSNVYYTDVKGKPLDTAGAITTAAGAATVGGGTIPPGAQGVHVGESRSFGTFFGRVIGVSNMSAASDATAVTGRLSGGRFLPVVFPVNIVDCENNGSLGTGEANWQISEPGTPPVGQEYIVPLCKTGGGSFMILDLDGTPNNCDAEVVNPPSVQFDTFPADVPSDNGNNCAKQMVDEVNKLSGTVVLIPICDGECVTSGGSHAVYHIIKVAAFYLDYMSDQNGGHSTQCQGNGTTLVPIAGNGSSSCIAGWFVRYITSGPVGNGAIGNADSIGVQLIK